MFTMLAGPDTVMEENCFEFSNRKVLRSAAIYGPNGSGKTSFLDAIVYMKNMVCGSASFQPEYVPPQKRNKESSEDIPSEYVALFARNGVRYSYAFSMVNGLVDEEYLLCFPNGKRVTVFMRKGLEINAGNKFRGAFGLAKEALKDNRLFLSCAANYSNVSETSEAYRFFASDLVIYNPAMTNWMDYSTKLLRRDDKLRDLFVDFLKSLGTGIKDVEIAPSGDEVEAIHQQVRLADPIIEPVPRIDGGRTGIKIVYDDFEVDLSEESAGVQRLFQMICLIVDVLKGDKIMICDDFESSLHESIVCQIVQLFQDRNPDQRAQLIFTTHDTSLLCEDLFRRDQIWFTELNEERATDLYSLAELKDVRKYENKRRQYMNGKYGAIPVLNEDFFEEFKDRI